MFWYVFHPRLHIKRTDPDLEDDNNDDIVEEEDEITEKKRKLVSFPIRDGTVIIDDFVIIIGNTNKTDFTESQLSND